VTQPHIAVRIIASTITMRSATATDEIPIQVVRIRNRISAMKAESMNTSPWAKFTMPMMPKTIVYRWR
jgi:hypothetical protein